MKHILLATHGTPGARKAEALARQWADNYGAKVTVLSIINEAWGDMTCDDWLNTSTTRNRFGKYVAGEIASEIQAVWDRVKNDFNELETDFITESGTLDSALVSAVGKVNPDVVIMGAWQKVQAPGFKDRFQNKVLHPQIQCPLVVAP
ncbi:universal stress protein [uncultured Pseudodesulfovibrio sp.]|uniref:universal stress protein n=1 Tax=uncultured Pseudodesulfovibrio sp. TaxID=2035858 RepID=UPI0029C8706A|nr:universal stress protein [uncultured Pseudodesulfovibrio sp.]